MPIAYDLNRGYSFLPNLTTLDLYGVWLSKEWALPTISPLFVGSLQHLMIQTFHNIDLGTWLQVICDKSPNLLSLHIKMDQASYVREDEMKEQEKAFELLSRLQKLQSLQLPLGTMTESLFFILARLPRLRRLFIFYFPTLERFLRQPLCPLIPIPNCGGSLHPQFPSNLTSFCCEILDASNLEEIMARVKATKTRLQSVTMVLNSKPGLGRGTPFTPNLSSLVAGMCPDLRHLFLCSSDEHGPTIESGVLAPFAICRYLTSLEIYGLESSTEELRAILCTDSSSWSSLRELALIGIPTDTLLYTYSTMSTEGLSELAEDENPLEPTLDFLADLASHLAGLRVLMITVAAVPVSGLLTHRILVPFPNLEQLTFVSSFRNFRIPRFDVEEAAHFTSKLIGSGTRIDIVDDATVREILTSSDEDQVNYEAGYRNCAERFTAHLRRYRPGMQIQG